jgi:hypothetical protein
VGKTALLGYLSDRVEGWYVATAAGVESEMELAYSGLHQLCAPMLDRLERLPVPQRDALTTVFGLSFGPAPDRFSHRSRRSLPQGERTDVGHLEPGSALDRRCCGPSSRHGVGQPSVPRSWCTLAPAQA